MTSYKGRKKPTTGRDGTPIAGKRTGTTIIPTSGRTMHGSSGLTGRVLDPNNPFNSLAGPLGQGFGGVTPLGSNGSSISGPIVRDGLGRGLADLGGAAAASQGGNFMDFLTGLVGDGKVTAEVAALILQSATQYGMAVDQRQYDNQLTQDQRQYDWNLLQDSRLYNSPTNELARLMGAGISRDAAIQLLNSSGGAGSGGSGSPVVSGVPSVQGMDTPGDQDLNIANTAINGFTNLVNMGFSVAQSVEQIKLLKSHSYMSHQQAQAYDTANSVFNTLQAIGADSDAYGSVSSALTAIGNAAQGGNEVAKAFMLSPHASRVTANGAFVAPVLAQMYKDNRNASDYKQRWFAEFTNLNLQNGQIQQQTAKLAAETKNLGPIYDNIVAQTDFIEQQTEVQKQTVEYLKQQGRLVEAEAYEKEMQNAVTEGWQGMTFTDQNGEQHNGLWFASSSTLYNLVNAYDAGLAQTDETYRNYVYDQILVDQKASYYASFLKFMNDWLGADFVVNHPEHAAYYNGLEKIGYYRHIENIAKGVYEAGEHATADLGPLGTAGVNYGGTVVPQTPKGFETPNIISDATKDDYMNTDKRGKQRKNRK